MVGCVAWGPADVVGCVGPGGRRSAPTASRSGARLGGEGAAQGASGDQRGINFNMAAPHHIAALQVLLSEQQGAHTGLPGGLGNALTDAEREALLLHAARFRCENVRVPCTVSPDEPDAHETIHKHITVLMHKLVASKWYLKELEAVALESLATQFQGRAADHWVRVVGVARVTATTSGIGHNSVLYLCLRDMLLAYPATGIKANLLLRKTSDLPWNRKLTVAQICTATFGYYEAYDRAVALTQHLDATLLVPEQDWPTRFTEMQVYFPEWATKLVVDYPGRFTSPGVRRSGLPSSLKPPARLLARLWAQGGGWLSSSPARQTILMTTMPTCCPPVFLLRSAPTTRMRSTLSMVASSPCAGLPVADAAGHRTIIARTACIRRHQPSSRAIPSINGPRCRLDPPRQRGLRVWCRVCCSCARSCLRRRRAWLRSPTKPRRRTLRTSSPRSTSSTCRLPCRERPWHP